MLRALLILLLIAGQASSQEAPGDQGVRQQESTQPTTSDQNAQTNQQNAQRPPIIVNVIQPPKSHAQEEEEARERKEKAELDRQLVDYTKELASFTAGLFYATLGVGIATIFLVIATAVLAIFGFIQSRDMKASVAAANRSAKASEDSLIKLQRAFVTFQGLRYLSHVGAEEKIWWSVQFNWFNSGSSPARRERFFASKYFEDVELPENFKFEAPVDRPTNFIGPNTAMHVGGLSLTADELLAVREGKKFLCFWGRADYRDIFDKSPDHVTKFSIRVRDFRGDPSKYWDEKTNIVELIIDNRPSRHNCADDDCQS